MCVRDACELSDNGLYVLLKAKNQKALRHGLFTEAGHINDQDFKIIGQSYVWRSLNRNLCFDSIECLEGQISDSTLAQIIKELAGAIIAADPEAHFVNAGTGGKTPKDIFEHSRLPEKILRGELL